MDSSATHERLRETRVKVINNDLFMFSSWNLRSSGNLDPQGNRKEATGDRNGGEERSDETGMFEK